MQTASEIPQSATHAATPRCDGSAAAPQGVVIGEVLSVDADGRVWLRLPWPGRERICASCSLCEPSALSLGARVAVLFQEQNADLAVVVGPIVAEPPDRSNSLADKPDTIVLEAGRQVTLRCGKASIQLLADGSVLIRGAYVLSRASGTNRIRGGNVQIN